MPETTTVKLPTTLRNKLAARAKARHVSQAEVLAEALETLDRRDFWTSVSKEYAQLQSDRQAWRDYAAERNAWVDVPMAGEQQ
ncbi:MAG: hypothetical protein DLM55_12440 [Acidimicrobiales bacterium]|nr:MAG: hypothetical protein DLM55_12440 [Acidimicrobiales bacterium]